MLSFHGLLVEALKRADWLDSAVTKRIFSTRSHGIELCLLEGKKKYG